MNGRSGTLLTRVPDLIGTVQHALASGRRVREAFGLAPEVENGTLAPTRLQGRIEFRHDEHDENCEQITKSGGTSFIGELV